MARKNKLKKFSEILNFPNVVENYDYKNPGLTIGLNEEIDLKSRWKSTFFQSENNLVLELACGRGEYTVALAEKYPHKNFLGVDVKGARIWKGANQAMEKNLKNAGFLRTRIEQIDLFFEAGEVDEIWLTFPDPFLMKERNRLTYQRFLEKYYHVLKKGSLIHLKTDDGTLYKSSIKSFNDFGKGKILYNDDDIYSKELPYEELNIKTYYEVLNMNRGKTIKYIRYRID